MTIVEQAENELRLLMLCKPSTARGLIEEITRLRAELDAANALVKRHEAALCAVWGDAHNWEFTQNNDYGTGVRTFGINTRARFDQWVIRNGFDTPLSAIEAALKEGK